MAGLETGGGMGFCVGSKPSQKEATGITDGKLPDAAKQIINHWFIEWLKPMLDELRLA